MGWRLADSRLNVSQSRAEVFYDGVYVYVVWMDGWRVERGRRFGIWGTVWIYRYAIIIMPANAAKVVGARWNYGPFVLACSCSFLFGSLFGRADDLLPFYLTIILV